MFGRKKKQQVPLVAGRDRASVSAPAAPVYSYYAGRSAVGAAPSPSGQRPQGARTAGSDIAPRRLGMHTLVIVGCMVVGAVCLVKLVAVTPNAKVLLVDAPASAVTVQRTASYTASANEFLQSSLLNRNKLTLDGNGISHAMLQRFPELTNVEVTTPLVGNRPVVYIKPAQAVYNLQTTQGLYSMDAHGFVLAQLSEPSPDLVLLKESSSRVPVPGKQYLATSIVGFCQTVAYQLEKAGGKTIQYIDLPATQPYEADVYLTGSSYRIKFNLQEDPIQQSGAAIATLQKLGQGGGQPHEYLDVRVPERVYYK